MYTRWEMHRGHGFNDSFRCPDRKSCMMGKGKNVGFRCIMRKDEKENNQRD
jgi:hypothetical protein